MINWGRLANELCVEEMNWAIYLRRLSKQVNDSILSQNLLVHASQEEKHGRMLQAVARLENFTPRIAKTSEAVPHWFIYHSKDRRYEVFSVEGTRKRRKALQTILNQPIQNYSIEHQLMFVLLIETTGDLFYRLLSWLAPSPLKGVSAVILEDEDAHALYLVKAVSKLKKKEAIAIALFWVYKFVKGLPWAIIEGLHILYG